MAAIPVRSEGRYGAGLAVVSNASHIVTYNGADFKGIEKFGLRAVKPRDFLQEIWGNTMSALSVRLPDSLHKRIKELARRDNVSINQMVTLAVAEKLSAIETEDYLGARASRASKAEVPEGLGQSGQ